MWTLFAPPITKTFWCKDKSKCKELCVEKCQWKSWFYTSKAFSNKCNGRSFAEVLTQGRKVLTQLSHSEPSCLANCQTTEKQKYLVLGNQGDRGQSSIEHARLFLKTINQELNLVFRKKILSSQLIRSKQIIMNFNSTPVTDSKYCQFMRGDIRWITLLPVSQKTCYSCLLSYCQWSGSKFFANKPVSS